MADFKAAPKVYPSAAHAACLALLSLLCTVVFGARAQNPTTPGPASPTITNLAQFWQLSSEAGEQEFPLRVQLAVNYYDADWKILWVGSESGGGCFLSPGNQELPFKSGQVVQLEGVARPAKHQILWERTEIKVVAGQFSQRAVPFRTGSPMPADLSIVEGEGLVIEEAEVAPTHLRLEIASEDSVTFFVHIGAGESIPHFKDAFVTFRGVLSLKNGAADP